MNDSASIHVTVDRDFEHIVVICKAVQGLGSKRLKSFMKFFGFESLKFIYTERTTNFQKLLKLGDFFKFL